MRPRRNISHSPTPSPPPEVTGPRWYRRVHRLVATRAGKHGIDGSLDEYGPYPEDLDEDIWEWEDSDLDRQPTCCCPPEVVDCDCDHFSDDDPSGEDWQYQTFKDLREERKEHLLQLREDRQITIESCEAQEMKVKQAMSGRGQKEGERSGGERLDLEKKTYTLYSAEYVRSQPWNKFAGRNPSLSFFRSDEPNPNAKTVKNPVMAEIYFSGEVNFLLDIFDAPLQAGTSVVGKADDNKTRVNLQFISRKHLKAVIPRSSALPAVHAKECPDGLDFVGVINEELTSKRKQTREDGHEARRKRRVGIEGS